MKCSSQIHMEQDYHDGHDEQDKQDGFRSLTHPKESTQRTWLGAHSNTHTSPMQKGTKEGSEVYL